MNWISCYLFHDEQFEKLLVELVPILNNRILKSNAENLFFFIRYWEGGSHLRLRYKVKNAELSEKIIEREIADFFKKEKELKYALHFIKYERESNRYGGDNYIDIAENHFYDSSLISIDFMKKYYNSWNYHLALNIAIQLNIVLVKSFLKNVAMAIELYDRILNNWIGLSGLNRTNDEKLELFNLSYKKSQKTMNLIVDKVWNNPEEVEFNWFEKCTKIAMTFEELNKIQKIENPMWFEKENELSGIQLNQNSRKMIILDSYIHMINNRMGVKIQDEAYIAFCIRKSLFK